MKHGTSETQALVLAGGRGTRLKQLTDADAKPAVPFGGQFRIIDFTLSNCINSGLRHIAVLTQYKAQSLIRHIMQEWEFLDSSMGEFIDVVPAQQQVGESWYSGTADAVFQNLQLLRDTQPRYLLVLAGDHVYKMDYGRMLAEHAQRGADVSVASIDGRSRRSPRTRAPARAGPASLWPAWASTCSTPAPCTKRSTATPATPPRGTTSATTSSRACCPTRAAR